jgi:hypothetical protein
MYSGKPLQAQSGESREVAVPDATIDSACSVPRGRARMLVRVERRKKPSRAIQPKPAPGKWARARWRNRWHNSAVAST